jgi:hypothetical protein
LRKLRLGHELRLFSCRVCKAALWETGGLI